MSWIDRLDDVLTTAKGRAGASREAAKFEKVCKPGVEYYSIEECQQPWGNAPIAVRHVFRKTKLGNLRLVDGTGGGGWDTPAQVWLRTGPLMEDPGPHIRKLHEAGSGSEHQPTEADLKKVLAEATKGLERMQKELSRV